MMKRLFLPIIQWGLKLAHIKPHISFLEKTDPDALIEYSASLILGVFAHTATSMPYYKDILKNAGVDSSSIKSIEDFTARVPLTRKTDIFNVFKAEDLCRDKNVGIMTSAIVSSGTSGVFSYGLLSHEDVSIQKSMIDEVIGYYYDLHGASPIIINALPMGVSFVSSYPVIPTSVRTDIVLHVISTFIPYSRKCIVITDPHVAKKIIEEGISKGIDWKKIPISFMVGGTWYSNSLLRYLLSNIAEESDQYVLGKNSVDGTMGVTEVGLNIFTESAELMQLRNVIQHDPKLMVELFGDTQKACPSLMYYYPTQMYLEIINPDKDGFGEIVLSQLDKTVTTPLMRYATGDQGKVLDPKELARLANNSSYQFKPRLGLPIVAITGRIGDWVECDSGKISPNIVKEALYRDHLTASRITGHFTIQPTGAGITLTVQAKKGETTLGDISSKIQSEIVALVPGLKIQTNCVAYYDFQHDFDVNYEVKWKHIISS